MKTPNLKDNQMNTTYGNLNSANGKVIFEGEDAGAVAGCLKLPPMAKVIDLKLIHGNLGAGTTVKIDAVGESGSTEILAAQSTAATGRKNYDGAPVTLEEETVLTLTTAGGAATGTVDLVVQYVYIGA